ncbi:rod shape-determining protein MreC [Nocardioides alcanivorans]|uniref:rod shape-determining protein MreC n=1 Tax=Nocardioides alcanivorans TaxID=2897352 RepID=UPI001F3A8D6B|nr:rod shape-determining protein MreC [Nocardioides alcanivorans]
MVWESLGRERRMRREPSDGPNRPKGTVVLALVLACATVMTLDHVGGDSSPLEGPRRVVGEVLGPVESAATSAIEPLAAVPDYFRTRNSLRDDVERLEKEKAALQAENRTVGLDRNRLAEYDALATSAKEAGRQVVPARVIAIGPAQSFSRTVTIDAGSSSGITPDLTVINRDGLVGRVLRVTRTTATVLLAADEQSVVGARVTSSMELGFLNGTGDIGNDGTLALDLVDAGAVVEAGDVVTTWGSQGAGPYVSGIPVGEVVSVSSSPRETSLKAEVRPFVDYTSLDIVGVVVKAGTASDRGVLNAEEKQ